jgi:hypothetical protein
LYGRRQRYKKGLNGALPHVTYLHPAGNRLVPTNARLFGGRLQNTSRRQQVRLIRNTTHFPKFRVLRKQLTQELQQELAVVAECTSAGVQLSARSQIQPTVLVAATTLRRQRLVRKTQRAVVWLKTLRRQFAAVTRRLRCAQRGRFKRKPRAWHRLLKTLDFEFVLDSKLDIALTFLDTTYAKIQPKIKTKIQVKTKAIKSIQAGVSPQKVQKIPTTPHKSWPTSPRPAPRSRPLIPEKYWKQ